MSPVADGTAVPQNPALSPELWRWDGIDERLEILAPPADTLDLPEGYWTYVYDGITLQLSQ